MGVGTSETDPGDPLEHLLTRLAPARDQAGRMYEQLRHRLIRLFEGRRLPDPESAADETLDRLARRLAEGVAVREPAAYVLGIARLVALERSRRDRRTVALPPDYAPPAAADDPGAAERAACLERCLSAMKPDARRALLEYYAGDGRDAISRRRQLVIRLAVTPTALRLRMFRLRQDLEGCVRACVDGSQDSRNIPTGRDTVPRSDTVQKKELGA